MPCFGTNEEAYTYDTLEHRVDAVVCGDKYQAVSLFRLLGYKSMVDRTTRAECWVVERHAVTYDACGLDYVEFTGFIDNQFYDHYAEAKAAWLEIIERVLA